MKNESTADAPFVFTVNYTPSIAQLSVKGRAQVIGEKEEISRMIEEHKQNRPPPVAIIQAVSSIAMAEAILLSKSLGFHHHSPRWACLRNKCRHSNSKDKENPSRVIRPSIIPDYLAHPKFWRIGIHPKNWTQTRFPLRFDGNTQPGPVRLLAVEQFELIQRPS